MHATRGVSPGSPIYPPILEQVETLVAIVDQYQHWNDSLSKEVVTWSRKLFVKLLDPNISVQEKETIGKKRARKLAQKILVDCIYKRPLKDPVLERNATWERESHSWYCDHTMRSPVDKRPMNKNVKVHEFAKKMIDWLESLPRDDDGSEEKHPEKIPLNRRHQFAEVSQFLGPRTANLATAKKIHKNLRQAMADALHAMDSNIAHAKAQDQEAIDRAKVRAAAHGAKLKQDFEALKAAKNGEIDALKERLAQQEEWHQAEEERHQAEIEACMKQMDQKDLSDRAAAQALSERLEERHRQHEQTVQSLRQQIQTLVQSLAELEQKFQETLKVYEGIAEDQRAEMQRNHQRIEKVNDELFQDKLEAAQLKGAILTLRQDLAYTKSLVNNMSSSKGGSCNIL